MILNIINPSPHVSEPLGEISNKQMFYQAFPIFIKAPGELELPLEYLLVDSHGVLVAERINSRKHLIYDDPQGPPVHRLSVALVQQNLRGQVLRSPTECVGPSLDHLRKAEVRELQIAIGAQQEILRLQVPVHYVQRMQILKHAHYLRTVYSGWFRLEFPYVSQVGEQFAALHEFQEEVEVPLVLGVTQEVYQEGVVDYPENRELGDYVVYLFKFQDFGFL